MTRARTFAIGWAMLLLAASMFGWPAPTAAHDGPPFAILVDRHLAVAKLSVWADPDVGEGTFLIYLEPISAAIAMPESVTIHVLVRPADGRLAETVHRAEPRRARKGVQHFEARVPFDRAGPWNVRVQVASERGGGEASTPVEVTPPGQGALVDFVLYLFPFAAIAFLFVMAVWRGRRPPPVSGA